MEEAQIARIDMKLQAMEAISYLMQKAYDQGDYARVEALSEAHKAIYEIAS
jgi:hypothetical protein